jgi:NAD-dependent dihydropyrimidine dehydrogenase PreA subunit
MSDARENQTVAAPGDTTMNARANMVPNPATPNEAIAFDDGLCSGCNRCVEICRSDVLMPNPELGKPPLVLYPDECWYCGTCVQECHRPGAIEMLHPLHQSISVIWVRKATGEEYRLGMRDAPPPNERPPCG